MSSAEAPNSMASTASAIMLPASAQIRCTPSTRSVLASARYLHEAFGSLVDLGAGVGGEGKLADIVGDAGGFQFFLGFPDRGDFRIGVDHVGDGVVVHVPGLPDQDFGDRDAFVLGLVRQHRPGDDVADRPDAGDIGGIMLVHHDAAARVERNTKLLQDRAHRCRARGRWRRARRRLRWFPPAPPLAGSTVALSRAPDASTAVTFDDSLKVMPCFSQQALRLAAHFAVHAGQARRRGIRPRSPRRRAAATPSRVPAR